MRMLPSKMNSNWLIAEKECGSISAADSGEERCMTTLKTAV